VNSAGAAWFDILDFGNYTNYFTLTNPTGQCIGNRAIENPTHSTPDINGYRYCVCCGEYAPDASLNCPTNAPEPTPRPTKAPTASSSQKVIGFLDGTLQSVTYPDRELTLQYEIKIDANSDDQRIYYSYRYAGGGSHNVTANLYFRNSGANYYCGIPGHTCTAPFIDAPSDLVLDIWTSISLYPSIYGFVNFNNSFQLSETVGQCTSIRPVFNFYDYPVQPNLYRACFCYGDEYAPDASLNCPRNPWAKRVATTPAPSIVSTPSVANNRQKLVGYFVGTFNCDRPSSQWTHRAQFQVRLHASVEDQRIYYTIDQFNKSYSNDGQLWPNVFWPSLGTNYFCETPGGVCSAPFVGSPTDLVLDITQEGSHTDGGSIYGFANFNNSFQLSNTIGLCTNYQPNYAFYDRHLISNLYQFCVCYGDLYDPDPRLGCPQNPWSPLAAPTVPPTGVVSSSKAVGYFSGKFQSLSVPSMQFSANYEIKLNADANDRQIYYSFQSNVSNIYANILPIGVANYYCKVRGQTCSAPFVRQPTNLLLDVVASGMYPSIFGFPLFENTFTLTNAVGLCTNVSTQYSFFDYKVDPALYRFCVCLGDEYNPHPSLNCPENNYQ